MGIIVAALERIYQSRLLNPVIIEFPDSATLQNRLEELKNLIQWGQLGILSGPTLFREARTPRDRFFARFQNPLLTLKLLSKFNMVALPLDKLGIDEIAQWNGTKIYPDKIQNILAMNAVIPAEGVYTSPRGVEFTTTRWTKQLLGLDQADAVGWNGEGITVAIPDTGGSPTHQQNRQLEYHSTMRDKGQIKDKNGHGEWCVSCVGGLRTFDRSLNVEVEGMATRSHLIGIKCLGFVVGVGFESDVIEAIQLSMERRADIISMSLGAEGTPDYPEDDAELVVIRKATEEGIIPIIAAGNSGPGDSTVDTPGCSPDAITVGAWDEIVGNVASFSSRGPVAWADGSTLIKPDLVSPGVNIYSGCIGLLDPIGDGLNNRFAILSGTSMATPQVAGLLACVKQYYKQQYGVDLTVDLVKTILAAKGLLTQNNAEGWGLAKFSWFKEYALETFGGT